MIADQLQRRFVSLKLRDIAIAAACGAVALGAAAYAESGQLSALALLGALLAGATAWRLHADERITEAIAPESDPDGVVRAVLSAGESHPYSDRLQREAAEVDVRFRSRPELPVFAGLAVVALAAAAWAGAAPAVSAPEFGTGDGVGALAGSDRSHSSDSAPSRDSAAPTAPDDDAEQAPGDPADGGDPQGAGFPARSESAVGQWQTLPRRPGAFGTVFRSGRDLAELRPWIERYYELKSQQP